MEELKPKPDEHTIQAIEEMLEEAKTGEIQQFYAIAVHSNGQCSDYYFLKKPWLSRVLGRFFISVMDTNVAAFGISEEDIVR